MVYFVMVKLENNIKGKVRIILFHFYNILLSIMRRHFYILKAHECRLLTIVVRKIDQ